MKAQYKGTTVIDNGLGKNASVVRNITYELIESEVESRIPIPFARPVKKTYMSEVNAVAITNLLKSLRDKLPFEKFNDEDERNTYIYGTSVYFVEWDDGDNSVNVKLLSPTQLIPEPNVSYIEDMNYFFLTFNQNARSIEKEYGVTLFGNSEDDEMEVVIAFFKENGVVSQYVFTEGLELRYLKDYYGKRAMKCPIDCSKECNFSCMDKHYEMIDNLEVDENISTKHQTIMKMSPIIVDGVMQEETVFDERNGEILNVPKLKKTVIPYFKPKGYPVVIRKNISDSLEFFGQSDADAIYFQQQEINKLETRIMEKLIKGGVMPYSSELTDFRVTDEVFSSGIKLKNPQEKNMLGVLDLQASISQDALQSDRLYNQAKRILGISDSFQGMPDSTATSGVAKTMLIQQSGGRLQSKRIMKNSAYADLDKLIFEFYLAFSNRPTAIYVGDNQVSTGEVFDPLNFVEMDENGDYNFYADYVFSCDITSDIEMDKGTMWNEIRNNYQISAYGDPNLVETKILFWKNMLKARYPFAKENILSLENELEKQNLIMEKMNENAIKNQVGGEING